MPSSPLINLSPFHEALWQRLQPMLVNKRIPQALLLVCPPPIDLLPVVKRLMLGLLCEAFDSPCEQCRACYLLLQGLHPDVQYVKAEDNEKGIKIEQIRHLQQGIYQTPQCGSHRFIVIETVQRMNLFSANALLKVLEEPPAHTIFILLTDQIGSLPVTITSRCQRYECKPPMLDCYLSLGQFYERDSDRGKLFEQTQIILTNLCELVEEKISICTLAQAWVNNTLSDILWFLYLLTAQMIRYQLNGSITDDAWFKPLQYLARHISPLQLFHQLDEIDNLAQQVNQNIAINQTLALENLLLGYLLKHHRS